MLLCNFLVIKLHCSYVNREKLH